MPNQIRDIPDNSSVLDPAGHVWTVATRIEETAVEQTDRWSAILAKKGNA